VNNGRFKENWETMRAEAQASARSQIRCCGTCGGTNWLADAEQSFRLKHKPLLIWHITEENINFYGYYF